MKKIIFSLIAFSFLFATVSLAEINTSTPGEPVLTSVRTSASTTAKNQIDVPCLQKAVGDREDATINAFNKRNESVLSLLTARKASLLTALTKSTNRDRITAQVLAHKAFLTGKLKAYNAYKKATKDAWNKFRVERKKCKGINNISTEMMNQANSDLAL